VTADDRKAGNGATFPSTFHSIDLEPQSAANESFGDFVGTLLDKLQRLKEQRSTFHDNLRKRYTRWANGARGVLAGLGALAFLLTGVAAALRFASNTDKFKAFDGWDMPVMLAALLIYAIMGTIAFYEKGTDKTTAYFRQVATILAIRDLWTKAQFALLKELRAVKDAPDPLAAEAAARERVRVLAEAFCADLDKAATGELTEFRTEFITSLGELDAAAKKGFDDVSKQLQDAIKAAEQAAAEARSAAEKAATAAKAVQDAAKPGFLNLTIVGEFDDEVVIAVDGIEAERSRGKIIGVERVPPGPRKIGARAKKGSKELETTLIVDVKPGLQDVRVTLG
jgi:hypothetical protein